MKRYLLLAILFCYTKDIRAQKNFEGVILYIVHVNDLDSFSYISNKVFFKGHKILLQASLSSQDSLTPFPEPMSEQIFDFDSGFIYEIDRENLVVRADSILSSRKKAISPVVFKDSVIQILGHNCQLVKYDSVQLLDDNEDRTGVDLKFADDLIFSLPQKYYYVAPYMGFVYDGRICLSESFYMFIYRYARASLTIKADTITPMQLPDSIFALPPSYKIIQTAHNMLKVSDIQTFEIRKENTTIPVPPPARPQIKHKKVIKKKPAGTSIAGKTKP